MAGYDNPHILVTRPLASATAFVERLRLQSTKFVPIIAPAFELEPVSAGLPPFDEAVFTSRAGVQFAPKGEQRPAWCVGTSTAQAAQAAGYRARSANGNADRLVDVILTERPEGRLLHLRGETAAGDVASRLSDSGVRCDDRVIYRKAIKEIAPEALATVHDAVVIIAPVFSAETVSILARWKLDWSYIHLVAISVKVAAAASELTPAQTTLATSPDLAAMTQAVVRLIA